MIIMRLSHKQHVGLLPDDVSRGPKLSKPLSCVASLDSAQPLSSYHIDVLASRLSPDTKDIWRVNSTTGTQHQLDQVWITTQMLPQKHQGEDRDWKSQLQHPSLSTSGLHPCDARYISFATCLTLVSLIKWSNNIVKIERVSSLSFHFQCR